jgi:hypothetical protein
MGEIKMSLLDTIREMVKEELEEAMGKKSRATKQPPVATKAGKKEAEEQPEELDERSLTKPEKRKLKSLEKKTPKKSFKDQYGKEKGEEVYYATLTKRAKEEA